MGDANDSSISAVGAATGAVVATNEEDKNVDKSRNKIASFVGPIVFHRGQDALDRLEIRFNSIPTWKNDIPNIPPPPNINEEPFHHGDGVHEGYYWYNVMALPTTGNPIKTVL